MPRPFPSHRFYVTLDPIDAYVAAASVILPEVGSLLAPVAPAFAAAAAAVPEFVGVGAFSDVTGLSGEFEVLAHPEGGQNTFVHQLPVRHTWGRITLKRGVTFSTTLWDWFEAGMNSMNGARRDGAIIVLSPDSLPVVVWEWRAGIATKWTGPDLAARDNAIAIESIEIAHEGLTQRSLGPVGGAVADAVQASRSFLGAL